MTTVETYLLLIAFVLFAALVAVIALGRIDARATDQLRAERDSLAAYNGRLLTDNAALIDALDAINGADAMPAEWTAFCADITPEDFR